MVQNPSWEEGGWCSTRTWQFGDGWSLHIQSWVMIFMNWKQIICIISWIILRRSLSFCQDSFFPTFVWQISYSHPVHLSHKPCYSFCMPTRNYPALSKNRLAMHRILFVFCLIPLPVRSTPLPFNADPIWSKPLLCYDNWSSVWAQGLWLCCDHQ